MIEEAILAFEKSMKAWMKVDFRKFCLDFRKLHEFCTNHRALRTKSLDFEWTCSLRVFLHGLDGDGMYTQNQNMTEQMWTEIPIM